MEQNSFMEKSLQITKELQKSKLRRFYFLLLTAVLFAVGAQANRLFNLDERFAKTLYVSSLNETATVPNNMSTQKNNMLQRQNMTENQEKGQDKTTEKQDRETKEAKKMVYASGEPVGIYIKTKGVLVLGTQDITTTNNRSCSPAKHKLESGDYILAMNGEDIFSKVQFISCLQKNEDKEAVLTISRNGEKQQIKIQPVYSEDEKSYQIGAWIRNDTQGIGTVTYITEDGNFAALGHGINDCDLGVQLNISGGSVYETDIASIIKGKKKDPGEVIGTIDYIPERYLGNIGINSTCGIFGVIKNQQENFRNGPLIEVAAASEIKTGQAFVRTSISGESKDYTIEIEKISLGKKDAQKALRIKVTDPELISLTGGIIQGLSGSPIIQNGKLVGAVTHVFVDEPTKGYGICAETMVEQGGK